MAEVDDGIAASGVQMDGGVKSRGWEADREGNRLGIPASLGSEHFFYKTVAPAFAEEDVATLVAATRRYVEEYGIGCAEIKMLSRKDLEACSPGSAGAMDRMAAALPARSLQAGQPCVLACEWASPHVDDSFAGSAFLSYVLDTGEHPYLMQTLHTRVVQGLPEVRTTTRVLSRGDGFVFDPTTPHMTAPKFMSSEQLLVLFQVEMRDGSEEERRELMRAVKPMEGDRDEGGLIGD